MITIWPAVFIKAATGAIIALLLAIIGYLLVNPVGLSLPRPAPVTGAASSLPSRNRRSPMLTLLGALAGFITSA
ncbi:MAG TPA: hypothetical protein VLR47_08375 [Rhodospirillales bacterium]|nr:hypothetical protein [Rhodospirillales bacterium]